MKRLSRIRETRARTHTRKQGTEETSTSGGCSFSRGSNTKDLSAGQPNSFGIWPLKRSAIQNFNPLTVEQVHPISRPLLLSTDEISKYYLLYIYISIYIRYTYILFKFYQRNCRDYFEGEKKGENSIYLPSTNTRATKTRILRAQLRE